MIKCLTLVIGLTLTALSANPAFAESPATAPATPVSEPAASKQQTVKIGYIDMAKIAAGSKDGKAAAASLKAKSGKLRTRIEAKQKQIEKEKTAIEAKINSMPPKERAAKAKEFQKKMEEYQKLVMASEKEMLQMQDKLTSNLYNSIKKAAASYAKSHDYTAVLEQKAVLYLADTLEAKDLTEEISKMMDVKPQAK